MPAPVPPPPADEQGAVLSPRQLNRWLDVNPVFPLTRTQTYLTFPAFNILYSWKGYSELVSAFNFEAPNNFTLPTYTTPDSPDYVLCISWQGLDRVVHRYKLWENVGEVFYFDVPLYTGQLIKGNFRFEVWSVEPAEITVVTVEGGGSAAANQSYTYESASNTWIGDNPAFQIQIDPTNEMWQIISGIDEYYNMNVFMPFPLGLWLLAMVGVAPVPFVFVGSSSRQNDALTFYTSVRGNFDYMWRDDNALAVASAVITDFTIADINAPWTAPDNSISTINQ